MFWTQYELTWTVIARVNGESYSLFGCPDESIEAADQLNLEFTATHTKVTLKAGSVKFLLDFFSPVSLTDYVRQSIPLSYLTVTVKDAPRLARIDILSAIDDSWTAQNATQVDFIDGDNSAIFTLSGVDSIPRTEWRDMATYGQVVFAADKRSDHHVSYQSGRQADIKNLFKIEGSLKSESPYESGDWVALAYRLSNPHRSPSVTFAVGLERDELALWLEDIQTGYYQCELSGTEELVDHFFDDEKDAREEASELDSKIKTIGGGVSTNYTDILEASVRQMYDPSSPALHS